MCRPRFHGKGCAPACQLVARYYSERPQASRNPGSVPPVTVRYDKSQLKTGDTATATVRVTPPGPIEMAMVDLSIPPGFMPVSGDLEAMKKAGNIMRYEITGPQLILYLQRLDGPATFQYRLRALFPVNVTVRPSVLYPYYEPQKRYTSDADRLQVL